jgi:Ca2+-binding RTX toxin-like protein
MLIPGVACQSGDAEQPSGEDNEFGVLFEGLGDNVVDCTAADATAFAGGVLTMDLADGDDAVLSVVGGKLKLNGRQCAKADGTELTTTLAPKLVFNTVAAATNKVVFDLLPGDFAGLVGATGGITVNINATATVSVGVRGTDATNNFKMAQSDSSSDLFIELNNNTAADVKIIGNPSSVVFTLAGGADQFNATDTTSLTFQTQTQAMRAVQTEPLTVYGGAGADVIEGGLGNDVLNGGADNDTFNMKKEGGDGADTYIGGLGTDTVDYSVRDAAGVTVDIAPSFGGKTYIQGDIFYGVDVTGLAADLTIGAQAFNFTAAAGFGIKALVDDLNAGLVTASLGTAFADDNGRILIVAANVADDIVVNSSTLGFTVGTFTGVPTDADDGATGEHDDVGSDVENLKGTKLADNLSGNQFANVIDGGEGNDVISGGLGGTCTGVGADIDTLTGGLGNDTFPMGGSNNCADIVDGGTGTDIANYERRAAALTVSLDNAANDGEGSGGSSEADNIKGVEVLIGGLLGDTLTGGATNDEIHGGPGIDNIKGGAGNDTLVGNAGNDVLSGELGDDFINEATAIDTRFEPTAPGSEPNTFAGADTIHGGAGINTCDFRRGDAPVTDTTYDLCFSLTATTCANNPVDGVDGDDLTNCSYLKLDDGKDIVNGSGGDDTVDAGAGDDVLNGGNGNDTLYGEDGDDTINGQGGFDTLDGGPAVDQLLGVLDGGADDDVCSNLGSAAAVSCEQ